MRQLLLETPMTMPGRESQALKEYSGAETELKLKGTLLQLYLAATGCSST